MNPFQKITGNVFRENFLSGGDINDVRLLETESGLFVLKTNHTHYPSMFMREADGLRLLHKAGLPVPQVFAASDDGILLSYHKPGPSQPEEAGRALANLHCVPQQNFGLDQDNYIGSLVQKNTVSDDFPSFYGEYRIGAQIALLKKRNRLPAADEATWEKLRERLPQLLAHATKPSLLHGDLWSGNLHHGEEGPVFIDPAVYRGDPWIDVAFSEMFGGFSSSFYHAYSEICPLPAEYQKLKKFYHIYPLLVHANLFGGGYYSSALSAARSYL